MKNLKIAFIRTNFPTPGGMFVYDRITGFIDLGYDLRIFALAPYSKKFPIHEIVKEYNLLNIIDYHGKPASKREVLKVMLSDLLRNPKDFFRLLFSSLDIKKFGRRSLTLSAYFLLRTYSKYQHFDIIYSISGPVSKKALFLKDLYPKAKFVVNFVGFDYSSHVRRVGTNIYSDIFKYSDLVISHSHYSRDCIISLGCPASKIIKHPVGVNISKLCYKKRILENSGVLNFITVGRLVEKKAHRIILSAVSNILRKGKKITYHIVGDGNLLQDVLKQIESEDLLKKNVIYHGYKTQLEVIDMLHKCHVFVHPSITAMRWADQEDTTVTLLEAQATGMPVISTYHAGIPEVVLNNITGILVPERNVYELEKAMEYFIDNPENCVSMGEHGRKYIEENFDLKKLDRKLDYVITKLINMRYGEKFDFTSTEELQNIR